MAFAKTCLFFLFAICCFASCEEQSPKLNLLASEAGGGSSELAEQEKGVLIEEFTGVRCVNCPAGAEAIAQFKGLYGSRLVPISIHSGFFSNPYPENLYDFRRDAADDIETFVGGPQGYPSAVIDRKKFDGEPALQLGRSSWAGYIGLQLALEPQVAIGITPTYDTASRKLDLKIDLLGRTGTDGRVAFISVLLLENKILDYQLTPEGKQSDYSHEHALRQAITSPVGESIGAVTAGQTLVKEYSLNVPADYNDANLEIAAYIHYADADGGGKLVLQAVSVKI